MKPRVSSKRLAGISIVAFILFAAGITLWPAAKPSLNDLLNSSTLALRNVSGQPKLVAAEPMAAPDAPMCEWQPASGLTSGYIMPVAQKGKMSPAEADKHAKDMKRSYIPGEGDLAPLRVIRDTYPTYSALAVDYNSNEVYLQDENLFGIKVFDRMTNTPPNAAFSEPKRMIGGPDTKLEFNCGLYVDPKTGDVYSVANDTVDTLVIFPRSAEGNEKPGRELKTPHGTFGIAVDEDAQEMFLTVQHEHSIVVYRKMASGKEKELRRIEGPNTGLHDPHGIALDTKNGVIYVTNHGNYNERQKPGSGKFFPPSITAYPIKGNGDIAPLRTIMGPKAMLDWPAAMAYDPVKGDLFVANDSGESVLVFGPDDKGDVAPKRIISGPKTGIKNPTGVYIDEKNRELWVANMGNHSATVYPLEATGNAVPLRTIRSAPADKLALAIGNPGAVAYDSKRQEILVPN